MFWVLFELFRFVIKFANRHRQRVPKSRSRNRKSSGPVVHCPCMRHRKVISKCRAKVLTAGCWTSVLTNFTQIFQSCTSQTITNEMADLVADSLADRQPVKVRTNFVRDVSKLWSVQDQSSRLHSWLTAVRPGDKNWFQRTDCCRSQLGYRWMHVPELTSPFLKRNNGSNAYDATGRSSSGLISRSVHGTSVLNRQALPSSWRSHLMSALPRLPEVDGYLAWPVPAECRTR